MASNDKAKDNDGQAPTSGEDAEPSHDDLYADIAKVRRRGVGNAGRPLLDLASLLWVARIASSMEQDAEKIEDTLERAAERLGGISAEAVPALLGLTEETRGQEVAFRRKVAAERYDHKAPESFRAHDEKQLLMAVATQLMIFVDKQRIADQQRHLVARQDHLIEAQRQLIEHNEHQIPRLERMEQILRRANEERERSALEQRPKPKPTILSVFRNRHQG